jgi:hypothetical protein
MLEITVSNDAMARRPIRRRWAVLAAGVVALLGSLAVTAPAQAGYYGDYGYGYHPCAYHCGYGYPHYQHYGCSACGCYRHCYSGSRSVVYERKFIERVYVERRYGCCHHNYGYPYGGYRHYGGYYPDEGYRRPFFGGYRRPFPYGYGGVRYWRPPYGYDRYGPYAAGSGEGYYEEPPRPPAPIDDY